MRRDSTWKPTRPKRRGTNWAEARDFWLALDPPRSFEDVGRHFGISGQRVGQIARRDNWRELADQVDAAAFAQAKQRIVLSRAERVRKTLGIVDGLLARYETSLDDLELKPADLHRLVTLAELLEGEATDRISVGEAQAGFSALMTIALKFIPQAGRRGFLDEVRNTIGDLGAAA